MRITALPKSANEAQAFDDGRGPTSTSKPASALMNAEIERRSSRRARSRDGEIARRGPESLDKTGSIATLLSADPASLKSLAIALDTPDAPDNSQGPLAQSLWMLVADFLAAAIPIVPFALLPVAQGRVVSATVTLMLLIGPGIGRAWVGGRSVARTVVETVSIGVAAALAGVAIGTAMARAFGA